MGGNALKNIETRRYARDEFEILSDRIVQTLNRNLNIVAEIIPFYHSKESFGDLDIVYKSQFGRLDKDNIITLFDPDEIVVNDTVISFNVEQLQVDLIYSEYSRFEYAKNYFAWNDCGNLIGKLCHKFGLKHGHQGLLLPMRDGDNMFAELLVTLDHSETLEFLGLDYEQHARGFDTLEDMFKFICSSKYFNPKFFAFESMNHIARIRDKKRDTYNKFLAYANAYEGPVWEPETKYKADYLEFLFENFDLLEMKFNRACRDLAFTKYVKTKFNGNIVSELTGLKGKELGAFMANIKNDSRLSPVMVSYRSEEDIARIVMEHYEKSVQSSYGQSF